MHGLKSKEVSVRIEIDENGKFIPISIWGSRAIVNCLMLIEIIFIDVGGRYLQYFDNVILVLISQKNVILIIYLIIMKTSTKFYLIANKNKSYWWKISMNWIVLFKNHKTLKYA